MKKNTHQYPNVENALTYLCFYIMYAHSAHLIALKEKSARRTSTYTYTHTHPTTNENKKELEINCVVCKKTQSSHTAKF